MDFLVRRRSFNFGQKEVDLRLNFGSEGGGGGSPLFSKRRSVSPLMSPMHGGGYGVLGGAAPSIIERNRQAPSFPQTEDEQLYLFHERILWNQERSLLPLAHDLSDWMSGILGVNVCPANFLETLQSGSVLCQLAKLIEQKAAEVSDARVRPRVLGRVRPNARPGSFFARDNVAIFLNFCKDLGVHPNLRFETNDLVSHADIRSVLICLMEVGRLSMKYGIDPPTLVSMEQEIDCCKDDVDSSVKISNGTLIHSQSDNQSQRGEECGSRNSFGSEISSSADENNKENPDLHNHHHHQGGFIPLKRATSELGVQVDLMDSLDSGLLMGDDEQNHDNSNHHHNHGGGDENENEAEEEESNSELDVKINEVTRISGQDCKCVEDARKVFKMRKLSEGKYIINGRTVFVRLLKGIHVMVRIGGGWETLEEFLVRNDPCRRRSLVRRPSYYQGLNPPTHFGRPASSPPVMMLGTGLRPLSSCCSTPIRSRHSSGQSLNFI